MDRMETRRRSLPRGWYPDDAAGVSREIEEFISASGAQTADSVSGVAPHAGWAFSGRSAARAFARLDGGAETVVVVGGHLREGDSIVAADEDFYEAPQGSLRVDHELLERVRGVVEMHPDRRGDNTVEVQLPFVAHFFPRAEVIGLRAPPTEESYELGRCIAVAAEDLRRRVVVLGSTDLTHYGPNYGFSPAGNGEAAVDWVHSNDARLIDALLKIDVELSVLRARTDRSACSIGGALAAMGFASARGVKEGTLLEYLTSRDVHRDASFVGYAAIVYSE